METIREIVQSLPVKEKQQYTIGYFKGIPGSKSEKGAMGSSYNQWLMRNNHAKMSLINVESTFKEIYFLLLYATTCRVRLRR